MIFVYLAVFQWVLSGVRGLGLLASWGSPKPPDRWGWLDLVEIAGNACAAWIIWRLAWQVLAK
jgi:hypothetical protein